MRQAACLTGVKTVMIWMLTAGLVSSQAFSEDLAARYTIGFVGRCDSLQKALQEAGYTVEERTFSDFSEGSVCAQKNSCLVFAPGRRFPYAGRTCLLKYLKDGGDLISLGGHAFEIPVYPYRDGWYSQDELLRTLAADATASHEAIDFAEAEVSGWIRDCDNPGNPSHLARVGEGADRHWLAEIRKFSQWDTFRGAFSSRPGHNALVFRIRGSESLREVVIEIREADGSRWVATAPVTEAWQDVVILQSAFQFHPDGSPPGRGKGGDALALEKAAFFQFGMAYDISPHKSGDYEIRLRRAGTARVEVPDGFGRPLFEKRLPIFSEQAFHRFQDADRVRVVAGQPFADGLPELPLPVSGVSAIGFSYADQSRYFGILEALDDFDRRAGFAGGALVHYRGPYEGGRWLIYGIETEAFYATDFFVQSVLRSLEKMRDRDFSAQLAAEADRAKKKFAARPRSRLRPIRRSADGTHLEYADGERFFMLGVNYIGSFDCKTSHASVDFVYDKWEADFKKAREAGVNCMRLWIEGLDGSREKMDSILYLADRYGIYLLLHPTAHPKENGDELAKLFSELAKLAAEEPAVIGYDLMNEPYITTVGSVRIGGREGAILRHDPFVRYRGKDFYDSEWVESTFRSRVGWPPLSDWSQGHEAKTLLAAYNILSLYSRRYIETKDYSSLYGIDNRLPIDPEYAAFFDSVNQTLADWIRLQTVPIRRQDPNGLITVGYNTVLTALPANEELDFVSHHLYQPPTSYADLKKAVTTMDRLRMLWPDKPITLGEFGYSCGTRLPDGGILNIHNSAVAEMIVYLYAWANDFGGGMSWMLSDWPTALMDYSAPWISPSRQLYEAGFGMYAYDGTQTGRPKPIVWAMKCMRDYLDSSPRGTGSFRLVKADTQTGCGYLYQNDTALFVGMKHFQNESIDFQAADAANLMLYWTDEGLHVLSTADASLSLSRRFVETTVGTGNVRLEGRRKSFNQTKDRYVMELFEGQRCLFKAITDTKGN